MTYESVLFYLSGCSHCLEFFKADIYRIICKLPLDKRPNLVECTNFVDLGMIDNPLIYKYKKVLNNDFPVFIFRNEDCNKVFVWNYSVEWEILREFIVKLYEKDFEISEPSEFNFEGKCKFVPKKIYGTDIICEEE